MKKLMRRVSASVLGLFTVMYTTLPVLAAEEEVVEAANGVGQKAYASAFAIGLASLAGALAMGLAIGKACEGVSKQPEASSKIQTILMLGLVFIETAIIYALIIAILIIFVL